MHFQNLVLGLPQCQHQTIEHRSGGVCNLRIPPWGKAQWGSQLKNLSLGKPMPWCQYQQSKLLCITVRYSERRHDKGF